MKLKKWTGVILAGFGALALTACHHKTPDQSAINDANSAYNSEAAGAEASGSAGDATFGDQVAGRNVNKHIYYFDFDKDIVHEQDRPAVLAQANYLLSHPRAHIVLEGHTDPRGSREYNIGLGERRANAIAAILSSKGVSQSQIRIVSFGAEKPATPGHNEQAYELDRRAIIAHITER